MRTPLLCLLTGLALTAGCTDLRFLDDAISDTAQTADPPELAPLAELGLATDTVPAPEAPDPVEALLQRGAALQARAAELR